MKKTIVVIIMSVIAMLLFLNIGSAVALTDDNRATDAMIFELIDSYHPIQEYQIRYRDREDFDHSTDIVGLCNISALTTLLNRRLAADYQSSSISSTSVMKSIKTVWYVKMSDKIYYDSKCKCLCRYCFFHGDATKWHSTVYKKGSKTYSTITKTKTDTRKAWKSSESEFYAYLASLLHDHPEGLVLHAKKGSKQHTVVAYKYTYANGKYTIYIRDPTNVGDSINLDKSSFKSNQGENLNYYCDSISYFKEPCDMLADVQFHADTLEFQNIKYPSVYNCFVKKGKTASAGFNLSGVIVSDVPLVSLDIGIYKSTGEPVSVKENYSISGKLFYLSSLDNGQDNGQKFSKITQEGDYYWQITAHDSAGRDLPLPRLNIVARKGVDTVTETISWSYDDQSNQSIGASRLEISKSSIQLEPAQTETLSAKVIPSNTANKGVVWSSDNESVAVVDQNGTVTAVAPGSATITAETLAINSLLLIPKTATCTVDVIAPILPDEIIASNLDEYHTAKGVRPDPTCDDEHIGFALEKFYSLSFYIQAYTRPDVSSGVVSSHSLASYFHVKAKVRKNGVLWYQLEDDSYVQVSKLSEESWFTTAANVQLGSYIAVENASWTKAPFETPTFGTMAAGTRANVDAAVYVPSSGMTWYRARVGNEVRWLHPAQFACEAPAPSISISGARYPSGARLEGLSFELKGKITSSEDITSVAGAVYDLETESLAEFSTQVNPAIITPNKQSIEIYPTAVNTSLKFGDLSVGNYRYELKVTTSSGYEKVLISSTFTVVGKEDPILGDYEEFIPITSLSLSKGSFELEQKDSCSIVAIIAPENATVQNILWTSSDPSVATVNSNGMVSAVGVGTATITAATTDGSGLSKQITVTAIAAQASADGFEYTIKDGKVSITGGTVSGTVRIPETIEGYPVVSVRGLAGKGITSVYIPKTVTDMWTAFYQDKTLTYAYFEDGATIIPSQAFQATSNLKYVYIPDSVTEIAYYAFTGCDLSSVQLPSNLKKIGFNAFAGNSRLSEIELPSGLEIMEDTVFARTSITSVTIPSSVNSMVLTFSGCNSLRYAFFEEGTTTIHDRAFNGAASLEYVAIPDSVTKIESGAFGGCIKLTEVDLPQGVTDIGGAFGNTGIEEIWIPNSVVSMSGAFDRCSLLTTVYFEDGITAIPQGALRGASAVQYVYIPDSITSIGNQAFSGCASLAEIHLPDGLTSIGSEAFRSTLISSVVIPQGVTAMDRAYVGCENIASVVFEDGMLQIPAGALDGTVVQQVTIPDSVTSIGERAFNGCAQITEIELPSAVTAIGASAFAGSGITSIQLPPGLLEIGVCAFKNCSGITSIDLPDGLTIIEDFALYGTGLTSIVLPPSLISIGNSAFENCLQLNSINFSQASLLKTIGNRAFMSCPNLNNIDLPDSITTIGAWSFKGTSLTGIRTPINWTKATSSYGSDNSASPFAGCETLTTIEVPEGATVLPENAFACNSNSSTINITEISLPSTLSQIGIRAFAGTGILSIDIPDSVTTIGNNAFKDCTNLSHVIWNPNSAMTTIGNSAFLNCTNLTDIDLPDSITTMGAWAFKGTALTSVRTPISWRKVTSSFGNDSSASPFAGCETLTTIEVPEGATILPENAFASNSNSTTASIVEIRLPGTLNKIENRVFAGTGISSIRLPSSLTRVNDNAFANCSALTDVLIASTNATFGNNDFNNCNENLTLTVFPDSTALSYAETNGIPYHILSIMKLPSELTGIEDEAFFGSACEAVIIPDSCESIGSKAFANCPGLLYVRIPASVTHIDGDAFVNSNKAYLEYMH